jgi:hypothetical protein
MVLSSFMPYNRVCNYCKTTVTLVEQKLLTIMKHMNSPLVEQKLLTLMKHMNSPLVFSVARYFSFLCSIL